MLPQHRVHLRKLAVPIQGERDEVAEKLQASQDQVQALLRAKEDAEECVTSRQCELLHEQRIRQDMASELVSLKDSMAQVRAVPQRFSRTKEISSNKSSMLMPSTVMQHPRGGKRTTELP